MSTPGFAPAPLPLYLRAANRMARFVGTDGSTLHPEKMFADAARHARLPARFPTHVEEAVDVLCRSLRDEANLHWFGRLNVYTLLVTGLASLLRVEQQFADDPTLAHEPLVPPLIVTGLPRSGTTFLHRLLAAAPQAAAISMARHIFPLPHTPVDYRRFEVTAKFLPWLHASRRYGLDAMHYVRPHLPDECNFGMRLAGRSMLYWATAPTYSYLRWLLAQDLRESYQLYRKVLLLHQRHAPGKRLVLKCPHHLAWLPALTAALPEALIVQTHRTPQETLPSECKLVLSLQALSTHTLDWQRTVAANTLKVRTFAERATDFADTPAGARMHHVDYRTLVRRPLDTVRAVYAHFGLPLTASHATALSRFATVHHQHQHGRNTYSAAQFGLEPSRIDADFAAYRSRFGGVLPAPQGSSAA